MICKELLQALLDGNKIRNDYWDNQHYLYIDEKGNLIEHFYGEKKVVILDCIDLRNDWIVIQRDILSSSEKETIDNITHTLRNYIMYVAKYTLDDEYEYIKTIMKKNEKYILYSPIFPKGTAYKGMELNKKYTLKELGL